MSKVNYTATSPYASTPQTNWYIKNYVHRPIPAATDDEEFEITSKYLYRPDILSFDRYGTAEFYWIFAVRNRNLLQDMPWDFVPGVKIMIPTYATLKLALSL